MKRNDNNDLTPNIPTKRINPDQHLLDLNIERQTEVDGVGMGVLNDGTAFFNQRGLAKLCGIENAHIGTLDTQWDEVPQKPRITSIKKLLSDRGVDITQPSIKINQGNKMMYAYSDDLCLAVLEYYAFEAGSNVKEEAKKNYRAFAGKSLRDFIYAGVGYMPGGNAADKWKQFHDRMSLVYDAVPEGYFGVFKEISDMIVTFIQEGLTVDEKFVPDISVGIGWGKHWTNSGLETKYGKRIKYDHNYPDYFPQAMSNPQDCWCYPEAALGEFRKWIRDSYIRGGKMESYLKDKVATKHLPSYFATKAVEAYQRLLS